MLNTPVRVLTDEEKELMNDAATSTANGIKVWGCVEMNVFAFGEIAQGGMKIPYDSNNPNHKRNTAIDIFIIPLDVMPPVSNSKNIEDHHIASNLDWIKVTRDSIFKCLGNQELAQVLGKWAQVEKIQCSPYWDKSTPKDQRKIGVTEPKGYEWHFKFIALYDTENECRAAYLASGNHAAAPAMVSSTPDGSGPTPAAAPIDTTETDKQTGLAFLKVIVPNACNGKTTLEEKKIAVTVALAQYPTVNKFFTVDSPEVTALIGA